MMKADRRKRTVSAAIAVVATLAITGEAMAAACLKPSESAAVSARLFQTELMVAALTCQRRGDYNTFIRQFGSELASHGKQLKATFNRMYGANGTTQLNRFVTRLANEASLRSLQSTDYCGTTDALFAGALAVKSGKLSKVAATQTFSTDHGLPSCAAEERVAQIK